VNANKRQKENKEQRFVRIAEARVNKIACMLRKLGNCSTVSNYDFTEEQVKGIFNYLQKELDKAKSRFDCAMHKIGRFRLEETTAFKEYPSLELDLPNGGCMRVKAIDDENWPAMKVEVFEDGEWHVVSETEYNEDNTSPMHIGVCIYEKNNEDSVEYIPYKNFTGEKR